MNFLYAIDDDPMILKQIEEAAKRLGCTFQGFRRLKDAGEAFAKAWPDAIVLDGLLPDGQGLDFLRKIQKTHGRVPRTLFFSALFKDFRSYKDLKSAGVEKIIHKPIAPQALLVELALFLQVQVPEEKADPASSPALSDFEAELVKLRQEYREMLVPLAGEIENLVEDFRLGKEGSRKELSSRAHRLAGNAGTYGFPEISESAKSLEMALEAGKSPYELAAQWRDFLALLRRTAQMGAPEDSSSNAGDTALLNQSKIRSLLILDDDGASVEILARDFESLGISVTVAETIEAAQESIKKSIPDALIIDYALGHNLTGVAALSRLRTHMGPGVPVIFLTVREGLQERIEAAAAGALLYVTKPSTARDILKSLGKALPKHETKGSVLLVDDDPAIESIARRLLEKEGIEVRSAKDPQSFWNEIDNNPPSLLILDWNLPMYSGLELCKIVKADPRLRETPVAFLSARMGMSERVAAFDAGAEDYIPKPIVPAEFVARVKSRLQASLWCKSIALRDPLTGLLGRGSIEDYGAQLLRKHQRKTHPTARAGIPHVSTAGVMLFDLDNFKRLNDRFGHLVGDRALQIVADAFRHALRASDLVGRWGGEEFLVLMEDAHPGAFASLFSRIQAYLMAHPVRAGTGQEEKLTLSAGATMLGVSESLAVVIQRADEALYRAKENGKNRLETGDNPSAAMPARRGSPPVMTLMAAS
ncbi:MAG: response regulator [Bdellovibrionota bacterium]